MEGPWPTSNFISPPTAYPVVPALGWFSECLFGAHRNAAAREEHWAFHHISGNRRGEARGFPWMKGINIMTTATSAKLNDVDLESVGALISAVAEDPSRGQTEWKTTVTWKGGFRSEASTRDFDPVPSDEPAGLGGTDTAPNPVEQLLGALGNCLAVGYAANATAAGIKINDLRIDLSGDVDLRTFLGLESGHAGYDGLEVKVHWDADADREQLDELHDKVLNSSPVGHTLSRAIPLDVALA